MKTPKLIVCVRHAESTRNKLKAEGPFFFENETTRNKAIGVPDHLIPITEEGRSHALRNGKLIHEEFGIFDVVIHSGYLRTIQTMDALLDSYTLSEKAKMHIVTSILIREREAGYAFNMIKAEIEAHFPWLQAYWKESGSFFARPVGGESMADVVEKRIIPFVDQINQTYRGKKVLLVLHGRTLAAVRFVLEKWSYVDMEKFLDSRSPKNCARTVYEHDQNSGALKLKGYNLCCD